jgi:hypothetical protein
MVPPSAFSFLSCSAFEHGNSRKETQYGVERFTDDRYPSTSLSSNTIASQSDDIMEVNPLDTKNTDHVAVTQV